MRFIASWVVYIAKLPNLAPLATLQHLTHFTFGTRVITRWDFTQMGEDLQDSAVLKGLIAHLCCSLSSQIIVGANALSDCGIRLASSSDVRIAADDGFVCRRRIWCKLCDDQAELAPDMRHCRTRRDRSRPDGLCSAYKPKCLAYRKLRMWYQRHAAPSDILDYSR